MEGETPPYFKREMKTSATIKLELSAFELDLLKDAVRLLLANRNQANDSLRSVRLMDIQKQLNGQEDKY